MAVITSGNLKNRENTLGTMNKQPEALKNHEKKQPGTITNLPEENCDSATRGLNPTRAHICP